MKVLKSGKTKIDWVVRAVCPHCKAELEIEKYDCILTEDPRSGRFFECRCLECDGQINLPEETVKKTIDNLISKRYLDTALNRL